MQATEALRILDHLLPFTLSNLQQTVFCQVWEEKTYATIATELNYEHSYIRDIGFKLWQHLSDVLGQKVSKSNLKAVLCRYARAQNQSQLTIQDTREILAFPSGPIPFVSKFYIERQPHEVSILAESLKPGNVIRLTGPRQIGKTSLLNHIVHHGRLHQCQSVRLSLSLADQAVFQSLNHFLRWLCSNLSHQLHLPVKLDDYWRHDIGSKVSCLTYIQTYILQHCSGPLLIAVDEVNALFSFPKLAIDFFGLLRTWYEEAKTNSVYQSVRWAIAYESGLELDPVIRPSCFNLGLCWRLPNFSIEQIQHLADSYGIQELHGDPGRPKLLSLLATIGRNPGMVHLALYHLSQKSLDLADIIADSEIALDLYRDHIQYLVTKLERYPKLWQAISRVVQADDPIELPLADLYRLETLGLIKRQGYRSAAIASELYRHALNASETFNQLDA